MVEVQPDVVTVLADVAIRANDLDEAKAIAAKELAEKRLKDKSADIDLAKAASELAEALGFLERFHLRAGRSTQRPRRSQSGGLL